MTRYISLNCEEHESPIPVKFKVGPKTYKMSDQEWFRIYRKLLIAAKIRFFQFKEEELDALDEVELEELY